MSIPSELNKYPVLCAFLESDPPDTSLVSKLATGSYNLALNNGLSLLQLCAYLGKTAHIQASAFQDYHGEIKNRSYSAIHLAAANGHLDTVNYLEGYLNDGEKKEAVQAIRYAALVDAAKNGHTEIVKHLESYLTDQEKMDAIKIDSYSVIRLAAANGHLDTLKYLETHLNDQEKKAVTKAYDYSITRSAAKGGFLEIIKHIERHLDEKEKKEAVKAYKYSVIRTAAEGGFLEIIKHLVESLDEQEKKQAIREDRYSPFQLAAKGGHIETFRHLETYLDEQEIKQVIKSGDYAAYRLAAGNGHKELVDYLEKQLDEQEKKEAAKAQNYNITQSAAKGGFTEIIKHIETHLNEVEKKEAVKANRYAAYRRAVEAGHPDTVRHLETQLDDTEKKEQVKQSNYMIIRNLAKNGHLKMIKHLETHLNEQEKYEAVKYNRYAALQNAISQGHREIVHHFLEIADVLAYVEMHDEEYGANYVYPFIEQKLRIIAQAKTSYEQANPNGVFDVSAEEARHCFYILRNLIRRNNPDLQDDFLLLMDIPAVKSLLHTAVTPEEQNELLRLALSEDNDWAATQLLQVPAVRHLAEQSNFYQQFNLGALDLRRLAQDHESSMTALTQGEQKRLKAAMERYEPMMKDAGVENLFAELLNDLSSRYQQNPASIEYNGQTLVLPEQWSDFQALNLDADSYQHAMMAYYQHTVHTVLRYFSKPNPWMANNASYVYVDEEQAGRYSTFEEYKPLIVLFWLAAIDSSIVGSDNFKTPEERLDHFLMELALIGRAHNWDKTRIATDAKGSEYEEEYDDLEGDKPSCFSGVKRRLFQSVPGHPLLIMLTLDDVRQELREFVRHFYSSNINSLNREKINDAIETFLDEDTIDEILVNLNISPTKQAEFQQSLVDKYGEQANDSQFTQWIRTEFSFKGKEQGSHLLNFMDLGQLRQFLITPSLKQGENPAGFFSSDSLRNTEPEQLDEDSPSLNKAL
ncbi:hypothetical protein EP47_09330 [Legionella norrlandica]|uniref:Uncharacterized protein n=1 Tax=Legionella norrlandica TaxID=1498499 RepID=A0A0A2SV83_9GAMM|nr:ankyrin repeat domain-containing protein [Legionella norrlandica]KGP63324.1 hypothetical protein EP47_09330 [Legionella norrlandica]